MASLMVLKKKDGFWLSMEMDNGLLACVRLEHEEGVSNSIVSRALEAISQKKGPFLDEEEMK